MLPTKQKLCATWPLLLLPIFLQAPATGQLVINLAPTGNTNADAAFQRAADFIMARFDDPITLNINSGFEPLGPSIIARANTGSRSNNYSTFYNQMLADITSDDDVTFFNGLPSGNLVNVWANYCTNNPNGAGSPIPFLGQVSKVFVTRANEKALGLRAANDPGDDSTITFNSDFAFDFNPDDGINPGEYDFVGVAIHEIFHAMGYSSTVDFLWAFGDQFRLDEGPMSPSVIDFLRYSPDSESAGAAMDFTADGRSKYYSIDGGINPGAPGTDHWSRGAGGGDRQPSHWRDNQGLGIMDPTTGTGILNVVSELDLQALDLMGWDRVVLVTPQSYVVTIGDEISGGTQELANSDDQDLVARRSSSTIQSIVEVEFQATSPVGNPSELEFCFEASVFARGGVVQTISLFNYDTNSFEVIDTRNASRFNDSTATITPTGDIGRFVDDSSSQVLAKVRFRSNVNRQNFSAAIDLVKWRF